MNKLRRKSIYNVIQKLEKILNNLNDVNLIKIINGIIDEIQSILDEEECVLYNIPENLQNSFRYEESENACDCLSDAVSELEDIDEGCSQEDVRSYILSSIQYLENSI